MKDKTSQYKELEGQTWNFVEELNPSYFSQSLDCFQGVPHFHRHLS